ncbi:MAG TPA: maleylpyruvate isomerase family mycothiol-dependent enzyme [Ornithinimicrobium sp.]|uniref:maleylpyruvate isomerase family mycothiol-dependent enzyme n=1 Tax=Ornithinimicrobium sp. TaxID=1977084 RepID=UPI002B4A1476|nr:maleylpyruvate isomerase family mycothiol-dependent enzyme [Ornithinimicrobium sp.]HKJ12213.1 maleylpyruvate isomerase family mycothiol-dependent enzyme [Ornithinimicrobium sp.]
MTTDPAHPSAFAQDYRTRAEAIAHLVAGATEQDWSAPSPCERWNALDVLSHMRDTQRDFLAGHDLEPPSPPLEAVPEVAWRVHTDHVENLLRDPEVRDRGYDGYFGPTTIGETVAQFYGWDMLVHRWDIGMAMHRDPQLSEADLDAIERDLAMFGEALYAPGICAPPVEVGPGASRTEQVMARLGRHPRAAAAS